MNKLRLSILSVLAVGVILAAAYGFVSDPPPFCPPWCDVDPPSGGGGGR